MNRMILWNGGALLERWWMLPAWRCSEAEMRCRQDHHPVGQGGFIVRFLVDGLAECVSRSVVAAGGLDARNRTDCSCMREASFESLHCWGNLSKRVSSSEAPLSRSRWSRACWRLRPGSARVRPSGEAAAQVSRLTSVHCAEIH